MTIARQVINQYDQLIFGQYLAPTEDRVVRNPFIVVLMGCYSDWCRNTLLPMLALMYKMGKVPAGSQILLNGRRELDWDTILSGVRANNLPVEAILASATYIKGDFNDKLVYEQAEVLIKKFHSDHSSGSLLIHLCCPESFYAVIVEALGNTYSRMRWEGIQPLVLFEKPLASNPESMRKLVRVCAERGMPLENYGIMDHYASKGGLISTLLEPQINRFSAASNNGTTLESIYIQLFEKIGVLESRMEFLRSVAGHIFDMAPRFLRFLLGLAPMLPGFNPQLLHGQVELILACMERIDPREVRLGQYDGYTEPGKPNYELDKNIPTGILFPMLVHNEKWGNYSGHPRNGHNGGSTKIYFHSAKAMPEDRKRIIKLARHVPAAMISQELRANFNVVNFEPIYHQWGVTNVRDPRAGKFSTLPSLWKMCNPLPAPSRLEVLLEAYTNLLVGNLAWLDTIKTSAMVMSILTPLYEAWKAGEIQIEKYPPGTWWPHDITPLNYLPVDPTQEDIIRGYAAHDEWKRTMLAGNTR